MFSDPGFYCVVAESDGHIAGSNCMDERNAIAGVGPITIDPKVQNRGIGRKLMDAVLDRARERNFAGVRSGAGRVPQSFALALHHVGFRRSGTAGS